MKLMISVLLIAIVISGFSQILTVEITGIKTDKGVIQLSVYRDKETFAAETPVHGYTVPKNGMVEGSITVTIPDLKPGTYGIALIDDKNKNGKMDYRFFVPIEGFGFSNYHFSGTRKPDFEAFVFHFSEDNTSVKIRVQYF